MPNHTVDAKGFCKQENEWEMLLSQIAQGNDSSLQALYDDTSPLVFSLALRILSNVVEAEEVTLDIYMQIWEKAFEYDPERSSPLAWVFMLTRSRAIDRLRSISKRDRIEKPLDFDISNLNSNPEETAFILERRQLVNKALSQLNPLQRKALELAYFEGYTQSEIATHMNQPLGTVKSWIRLGMLKLGQNLKLFD